MREGPPEACAERGRRAGARARDIRALRRPRSSLTSRNRQFDLQLTDTLVRGSELHLTLSAQAGLLTTMDAILLDPRIDRGLRHNERLGETCDPPCTERASSTTRRRTSTGYLLGMTSSSLTAGGFQKPVSTQPGADTSISGEGRLMGKSDEVSSGGSRASCAARVGAWRGV